MEKASFKWLRCAGACWAGWCRDAPDCSTFKLLPDSGGHWFSACCTERIRIPQAHPNQLPLLGARLAETEVPRALVCVHILMDDHLPLLTLPRFPTLCLGSRFPLFWVHPPRQLHMPRSHPFFQARHCHPDGSALLSLSLLCPFSAPTGYSLPCLGFTRAHPCPTDLPVS